MTPIPSITDDLLRELEAEYRAAENTQQLSLIRRLRESEARLWSICVAVTLKDVERVKRETGHNLDYLRGHAAGGD